MRPPARAYGLCDHQRAAAAASARRFARRRLWERGHWHSGLPPLARPLLHAVATCPHGCCHRDCGQPLVANLRATAA
ncbi:hypothetical protein BHE74_00056953 [Ensete ventricosum]|nr:hypothetical protein BHE74_00056953 [Ensete ventricosum]